MDLRKKLHAMTAAGLAALLIAAAPALAAGPGGGGGHTEDMVGDIYADLVVAYRAEDGTPILKKYEVPGEEPTDPVTTEYCVQPLSYEPVPGVTSQVHPLDGRDVWVLPLQGEWLAAPPDPLPVEEIEACDPQPQYAMFVAEAELERLNLVRTSEEVLAEKLAVVETKLGLGEEITLDGAGRLTIDGTAIDASPEHAAMYVNLLKNGTIPGLPPAMAGPPASVGIFDAWELMAASIGTAASKGVPITVDTVLYYNRVIPFPPTAEYVSPWGVDLIRSEDPDNLGSSLTEGERFVDYSAFTYNRSETFMGSTTYLDVPTLTWQVEHIIDIVEFTNLTNLSDEAVDTADLTGVVAFAQLADDVRAVINYLHENEVIPGFYIDPVGVDTYTEQLAATVNPAVDLGVVPENVFQTETFGLAAALYNPWGGTLIDEAQLRLTIDGGDTVLAAADVTVTNVDGAVTFTEAGGDLVGTVWGTELGTPLDPGDQISAPLEITFADGGTPGDHTFTLEVVDIDDPVTALADIHTIAVNDNIPTVMWGGEIAAMATTGGYTLIPVRIYAPAPDPAGELTLTISGPGDDPLFLTDGLLEAGDAKVYGVTAADMVAMPLTLDTVNDDLVGTWPTELLAGYTDVTWYLMFAEGAPEGTYGLDVDLTAPVGAAKVLEPAVINVVAAEVHKPGDKPSSHAGGPKYANASVLEVSYTADDVDGDLDMVELYVRRPGQASFTKEAVDVDGVMDWTFYVPAGVDGKYSFYTIAVDRQGNQEDPKLEAEVSTTLDRIDPTIKGAKVAPKPFDISRDRKAIFKLRQSEKAFDTFLVKRNGKVVKTFVAKLNPRGLVTKSWGGRNDAGKKVRNGRYVIVMKVKDLAGNRTVVRIGLRVTR